VYLFFIRSSWLEETLHHSGTIWGEQIISAKIRRAAQDPLSQPGGVLPRFPVIPHRLRSPMERCLVYEVIKKEERGSSEVGYTIQVFME
jgi:hypothetical protein